MTDQLTDTAARLAQIANQREHHVRIWRRNPPGSARSTMATAAMDKLQGDARRVIIGAGRTRIETARGELVRLDPSDSLDNILDDIDDELTGGVYA